MTPIATILAALLATLPAAGARPAPAPSPPEAGPSAPQWGGDVDAIRRALDAAGIEHQPTGEHGERVQVVHMSDTYRAPDGERGFPIMFDVLSLDGQPWIVGVAFDVFTLADCEHPEAALQVVASNGVNFGTLASLVYDETDATVTARMSIPMPGGRVDGQTMTTMIGSMVRLVELTYPVLERAKATGMIDWPDAGHGPGEPTSWLETTDDDGAPVKVGWAIWAEETTWASTLVAADGFLRRFQGWNDEERQAFGRGLASDFTGEVGRAVLADWLRGARHLKRTHPAVRVRFWAPEGMEVAASFKAPGFVRGIVRERREADAYGHVDVCPNLSWDVDALLALEQPTDAAFEVEVSCGESTDSGTASVRVQPVGITDLGLPALLPVALYVNEMHPWVKDLLAEAARLRVADSLGVEADTSYEDAVRQVYAVWLALRARDLSYVSVHEATDTKGAQPVRQFHEAITEAGANCADGSAAFASALRAIGFDVHLATIPGHVFVATYLPDERSDRQWIYLETTEIGQDAALPDADCLDSVEPSIPERFRGAEWDCFEHAVEAGRRNIAKGVAAENLVVVSLKVLREAGVRPIPAAKSRIGSMPAPPDQAAVAQRRAEAREKLLRRAEDTRILLETLPNREPQGYEDVRAIEADILAVGTDHRALGRLLRAVDGDDLAPRSMRAMAAYHDALIPFRAAMDGTFGDLGSEARGALMLPSSGASVRCTDAGAGRFLVQVFDGSGEMAVEFGVRPHGDRMTIDGGFLERHFEKLTDTMTLLAALFRPGALADEEPLALLGTDLAAEVRQGKLTTRDQATDRLGFLVVERFGRKAGGGGGETEVK